MEKFNHSLATLILMLVALVLGVQVYAAMAVGFFFIGREHAQAEQRCIQKFYGNKRANAPWYCGFEPRAWNVDSLGVDLGLPALVALIVALI